MISPKSYEDIADYIEKSERLVLFFTADWCPDCQFIYPALPEIEEKFSTFTFLRIDRDDFLVENSSMIVAYYDGRNRGGTFYTMNQAERHQVPVVNLY